MQQTFGTAEGFWTGLNDQFREGDFEWASGQWLSYANWAAGQPNDAFSGQDYVLMNYSGGGSSAGEWNDMGREDRLRGIVEIGGDNTPLPFSEPPGEVPTAQTVVDGLNLPTAIDWLPDNKMLIAEKGGTVQIVEYVCL